MAKSARPSVLWEKGWRGEGGGEFVQETLEGTIGAEAEGSGILPHNS
jgi:hypothetical protein